MKAIISKEKVKELLPQKTPFVMVEELLEYSPENITTGMRIEASNLFIENGMFNESGLLENIAQSTALHTSYGYYVRGEKAPVGYIGTISGVKIHGLPKVDDYIVTKVEIIKEFMGVTMIEGKVLLDDRILVEAKMKTFIAEE